MSVGLERMRMSSTRKTAKLSRCRKFRYVLSREWDSGEGTCLFVMLNPSTADAKKDDQTISKCVGFAQRWGFRRMEVVNLFAYRATDPKKLLKAKDPVGPQCDLYLDAAIFKAKRVVIAWGSTKVPKADRVAKVLGLVANQGGAVEFGALGRTKNGDPRHPGRSLPYSTPFETIDAAAELPRID